jgi:hypothetical protein
MRMAGGKFRNEVRSGQRRLHVSDRTPLLDRDTHTATSNVFFGELTVPKILARASPISSGASRAQQPAVDTQSAGSVNQHE